MHSDTQRRLRRAVLAEGVTRLGDAVSVVALPLTAVLVLGASPAELALVGAAQALPILLLSIPIGAWVDRRRSRWPLMLAADVLRAALLASIPLAAAAGALSMGVLVVVAFLVSVAGTVFDLAYAGWLPRLLAGDSLHLANARVELARSSAAVAGPAMGGALVAAVSAPVALLADALSFVASAALVASIGRAEPPWPVAHGGGTGRLELAAGVRFIAGQPLIRAVTATAGTNNLARSIAMGVAILYLVEVGGLSAAAIGIAFALGHTGYLAGALASRRLSARLGMGPVMQLGVGLFGPSMLVFALAPAPLVGPAFTLMVFVHGFGISIHNVNQVTIRQLLTPHHLRARVAAVFRLVIFGALPVGTLIGGLIAEVAGLQAALIVSATVLFLGSVPYLAVRVTRLHRVDELVPAGA